VPKLAVSLSRDVEAGAVLGALERCGESGATSVVGPALAVDFGDRGSQSLDLDAVNAVLRALPADRTLRLHLRVQVAAAASVGEARATALESACRSWRASLDSGRISGVILRSPSPGDLAALQFTLARLVLQLKASAPAGTGGRRLSAGLVRQEQALSRVAASRTSSASATDRMAQRREWIRNEWAIASSSRPPPGPGSRGGLPRRGRGDRRCAD
jgi:hypothetical protein